MMLQKELFILEILLQATNFMLQITIKRKAYVAVINRCNYLIQNYPKAPKIADALIFKRILL
ncbi:MAG: hypothetical protein CM15mP93_00600 [Thiotrichaceae bacterium]|nr:MAG: hypothetical protein CM15mP93_00600 [Thiotrichaceae bacterium]